MVLLAATAAAITTGLYLDAKHFIGEDLIKIRGLLEVKLSLNSSNKADKNSIYYTFLSNLIKRPNELAYICENLTLTWKEISIKVNQFSNFLLNKFNLKRGETISLLMDNKPYFIIIWLSCLSLDIIPAFINYNLLEESLNHCIKISNSKLLIFDSTFTTQVSAITPLLIKSLPSIEFISWTDNFSTPSTSTNSSTTFLNDIITLNPSKLLHYPDTPIPDSRRSGITWQSPAFLIFTSGSTGLPKLATCTHGRTKTGMILYSRINKFNENSRIYTCMPLYHSTAAILAIGVSWNCGAQVIIGRKFSATKFWDEVRKHDANVIQYVGEVLRYLLAVPPSPLDKTHHVKLAYGNGCRPDIWEKFRDRFGVETISEFFASSEGNGSLFNFNSNLFGSGAVGHEGSFSGWVRRIDQVIVKIDPVSEEPLRDSNGFCIRAEPNENGELLCLIIKDSPYQSFSGYYKNESATEKKILRNVFKPNDTYFRTGDLLNKSKEGFYYFGDRLGDTFRWKGENVSTTQVAEILSNSLNHSQEVNVYGILLPGHEGRAGCAALSIGDGGSGGIENFEFEKIEKVVREKLPSFARPLFLRFLSGQMETTGTMKQLKVKLRNEGVDPDVHQDPVYWLQGGKYVPFKKTDWESLKGGNVKL